MFKKLLIAIPVLAIIIAALVQGTQTRVSVGQEGQRVVLATDSGVVDDRSFNQDAFLGVKNFVRDFYDLDGSSNNYVDGAENSKIGVLNNYKLALLKGANAIVAPGFPHIEPLSDPASYFIDDITVVLLEGVIDRPNIISVVFRSELSGLQAGFDAAVWATRRDEQGNFLGDISHDGQVKIGAFGGASNKFAVDNYLFGLFLGVQLFNITIGADENVEIGFANSPDGTLASMMPQSGSDSNFFTGTFALGDATRSGILGNLVDTRNADIIFPVAGPQVQDVISYRSRPRNGYSYAPYLVGVDVDQTLTYPNAAREGRFINSAIKNLNSAVYQTLSHARSLRAKNNEDGSLGDYNEAAGVEIWDGQVAASFKNWSEGSTGGQNKVQRHVLRLYEEGQGDQPIGDGGWDAILRKIIEMYDNEAWDGPSVYLNGNTIQQAADELRADIETLIDRDAINQFNQNLLPGVVR